MTPRASPNDLPPSGSAAGNGTAAADELWGDYWAGAGLRGCTEQFPPDVQREIAAGWQRRFVDPGAGSHLLDIGCGRGAVLALAREAGALARGARALGVDLAPAAAIAGEGFEIRGGVDATALPFADRSFTLVTSQFGIEYAGFEPALDEAARVAAKHIVLLTHAADGIVAQHAAEQADHVTRLIGEGDLRARLVAAIGAQDIAAFDTILADLAALAERATNHGLLEQVYAGVRDLGRLVAAVPAAELRAAVDFMFAELSRHHDRMRALARAAPARATIDDGAARLRAKGFDVAVTEQRSGRGDLVGYWLDASRMDQS